MTTNGQSPESFLLVDCGTTTTTAALFDVVEGSHRLIARAAAPTTAAGPWNDLLVGIQEGIERIAEITGRSLLSGDKSLLRPAQQNGRGVDHFGIVISAADPLRLIIAGLLETISVASARRAAHSIYTQELDALSLEDNRSEQQQVQAILELRPELILVAGGTEDGAANRLSKLIETVELGAGLLEGTASPQIIFAGNSKLREQITTTLGSSATVHVADNLRPALKSERLDDAMQLLDEIYLQRKVQDLPGIENVRSWSTLPILPTARAFGAMIEYLGALYRSRVLGLDLGSDNVVFAAADGETARLHVRGDLGMGTPLPRLLDCADISDIMRWLPVEATASTLINYVRDRALHPSAVPMTEGDVYFEHALARELMQRVVVDAGRNWGWMEQSTRLPPFSLLILRGNTLVGAPRLGQTVLMGLDALQPTGTFSITVDRYGVLPMVGLLAQHKPSAAVEILEEGVLVDLGWVIAPTGKGKHGQRALRVNVQPADQGEYRIDAQFGELIAVPLAPGKTARLTLSPARNVDVGFGPGRGKRITVHGGAVGLVIDARGRPLPLPDDAETRRQVLRQWHWDMGG